MDFIPTWWPLCLILIAFFDKEAALLTSIVLATSATTGSLEASCVATIGVLLSEWFHLWRGYRESLVKSESSRPNDRNPYTITTQGSQLKEEFLLWARLQIPRDYPSQQFHRLGESLKPAPKSVAISAVVVLLWFIVWVGGLSTALGWVVEKNHWLIKLRLNLPGYCLLAIVCGTVLRMLVVRLRARYAQRQH